MTGNRCRDPDIAFGLYGFESTLLILPVAQEARSPHHYFGVLPHLDAVASESAAQRSLLPATVVMAVGLAASILLIH